VERVVRYALVPQPRDGSAAKYLRLRRSIHCHHLTEKPIHPAASLAAGSSTWLSTETLRRNHDSLMGAGQGEDVEQGEAAELDVAGQAQH
jgi:hypothetical protein